MTVMYTALLDSAECIQCRTAAWQEPPDTRQGTSCNAHFTGVPPCAYHRRNPKPTAAGCHCPSSRPGETGGARTYVTLPPRRGHLFSSERTLTFRDWSASATIVPPSYEGHHQLNSRQSCSPPASFTRHYVPTASVRCPWDDASALPSEHSFTHQSVTHHPTACSGVRSRSSNLHTCYSVARASDPLGICKATSQQGLLLTNSSRATRTDPWHEVEKHWLSRLSLKHHIQAKSQSQYYIRAVHWVSLPLLIS